MPYSCTACRVVVPFASRPPRTAAMAATRCSATSPTSAFSSVVSVVIDRLAAGSKPTLKKNASSSLR